MLIGNKIIFLDIDGVLNVIPQGRDKYGGIFHQHFVDNLRRIIDETGAKIVISSSWRSDGIETMRNMWKDRNLPGEVVDVTPHLRSKLWEKEDLGRGDEIQWWLDRHPEITGYVIVDDDYFDILPHQLPNLVRTSGNEHHPDCIDIGYGLTNECTANVIQVLNGK